MASGQKQTLQLLGVAVVFLFLPGAASGGGLIIAPALALSGLLLIQPKMLMARAKNASIPLILFILFCLWAVGSTAWLQNSDHRQAWRLAGVFVTGLLFCAGASANTETRRMAWVAGAAAVGISVLALVVEWLGNMPFNRAAHPGVQTWVLQRNPGRGETELLTLLWPVMGALLAAGGRVRFAFAVLAAVAAGVLAFQFDMQANIVAFALGLAAFAFAYVAPRWGIWLAASALTFWLLAAPFIAPHLTEDLGLSRKLPFSWAARVEIWNFASARIMEQPWIGRGLDSARHFNDVLIVQGQKMRAIPLHPHSASLQIWLELGVVGVALAAATLLSGAAAMSRAFANNRPAAAAATATLMCFGFTSNVSYGAWQEWWVACAFIAAGLIAAIPTSAKG